MKESLLLVVFLLVLIIPGVSSAQEEALILSPQESASIFSSLQRGITEQWVALDIEAPEKQLAVLLLRDIARNKYLAFFPGFISTEIIKVVINAAGIVKRLPEITIKDLLTEIESKTVEEATRIATNWLLQNQVKTSSGDLEYILKSYKDNQQNIKFQYVITYNPIDDKSGSVVIELFSPTEFEPPSATSSIVLGRPWDIGVWLRKGETKIHPFILELQAEITRERAIYSLDSRNGNINIKLTFPEKVPVLKLAKELPYPLEEQKINVLNAWTTAKKVLEYLRSTGSEALGKTTDLAHKAQEVVESIIDRASQLLSKSGAGLVNPLSNESQQLDATEAQLILVTKDEAKPVENLAELSFPQESIGSQIVADEIGDEKFNPVKVRQEILELKGILSQVKDELEQEEILKQELEVINLSSAKDSAKDEAQPVDTLAELRLPQSEILIPNEDEEEKPIVSPAAWCDIDPNRGPGLSTVLFSEIAWMGSANSANDEWMKLKNISNGQVNLEGWQLQDKDNQIQIALGEEHSILSQGIFVLERTNDDSLPGIQANLLYTGALNNTNEALYLFDEKCILRDKAVAAPDWPAGDSNARKPMARSSDLGWRTVGFVQSQNSSVQTIQQSQGVAGSPPPQPPIIYPKILISEVQTTGPSSQTEEFVELYNPTQGQVGLTDWYIQKKTQGADSFSTFASKNILSEKTIQAGGYFLIAREGSSFASSADAVTSYSLADNNTLALKNPNGEITDKIGWGDVQDAENAPTPNPQAGHSLNRIWDVANQTYYDRDNNSIDFVLHNPASPKAQNIEDEPPPEEPPPPSQDATPPEVTLGALSSPQSNTSFSLSWSATDSGGEANPSGVQSIFVEYVVVPESAGIFAQYDNNGVWTNWQAGSTGKITLNAQATSLSIRGQDGVSYTFQVSARDVAENTSATVSTSTSVILSKTVVINEVAWAGTKAQSTDEWLELFNTTSSSADLAGWKIVSSDSEGPEITLSGTIAVGGFYLIERTDDQATTATAQLVASFGNGLSNTTCEILYLYNADNTVVDQTVCVEGGAWPAGTASPDYISMERIISTNAGSSASNWANNNLIKYNNKDVANNWINGTPGSTNSTATSPTTITELRFNEFSTITLTLLGSPYITTGIIIPATKTLIVEPGVLLKFQDNRGYLRVQGTLKAQGTQASGITFTVTDGGAIWCGIRVVSTSTDSQLDYVTIDKAQSLMSGGGGGGCNESSITYSMYVESSAVAINNSVIQTGAGYRKLYLKNSNSTINASTISGATLNADSVGIYIDGGSPTISNSTISNNSIGIFVNSLSNNPTIQNNTFTGNTYAIKLSSAAAALSGNTATNNTYNGIFFGGAVLNNMTWQVDSMPYIINKFTVNTGATLTIQEGAAVKFINTPSTESEITVQGTLITQGTQANPVAFAGITDTTTWKRIYIAPGSTGSQLTYTTITKGGNTYYEAALYVKQSDVQLSNVTISNSVYSGIYSSLGAVSGSGVILINNTYGFHIELGGCPTLSGTNVTANVGPTLHPSSFPSPPCSF